MNKEGLEKLFSTEQLDKLNKMFMQNCSSGWTRTMHALSRASFLRLCQSPELREMVCEQWISVEERLPDKRCLCIDKHKNIIMGYLSFRNATGFYECENDSEIMNNVTHWMPLPKSPISQPIKEG